MGRDVIDLREEKKNHNRNALSGRFFFPSIPKAIIDKFPVLSRIYITPSAHSITLIPIGDSSHRIFLFLFLSNSLNLTQLQKKIYIPEDHQPRPLLPTTTNLLPTLVEHLLPKIHLPLPAPDGNNTRPLASIESLLQSLLRPLRILQRSRIL